MYFLLKRLKHDPRLTSGMTYTQFLFIMALIGIFCAIFPIYIFVSQPKIDIQDLDVITSVSTPGGKGIKMLLDLDAENLKNRSCKAVAYFYYRNGNRVKSSISGYRTEYGQLSASTNFRPRYNNSVYTNLKIYIPYKYFENGKYKTRVKIYCKDKFLANTQTYLFTVKEPRIHIKDLDVIHNVRRSGRKGMKMLLDLDTENLKNRNCTAVAYFYYRSGNKVRSRISGYRTKDGQLSASTKFRPRYKNTVYTNLEIYIPTKYFKKGKYKASIKTYCGNNFIGNTKTYFFYVR